jgi:uncharacterized protein
MPYLIDGYNLYHAVCKSSEELSHLTPGGLCLMIAADMQRLRDGAIIVFDGRQPPGRHGAIQPEGFVKIIFSGPDSDADTRIVTLIDQNTAPRRLVVVSSDRQIRKAAHRRRATGLTSLEYLLMMQKRSLVKKPPPSEPFEKRHGTSPDQLNAWLKLFGIDPDSSDDPTARTRF